MTTILCYFDSMITVRKERQTDNANVFDVVRSAFRTDKEARLVNLVRDHDHARISLVAEDEGVIVGYVLASPITLSPAVPLNCLAIGPVAVSPACQNEGIGSQLMESAIRHARDGDTDALFLLGHPDYYPRFGFGPTHINNEYGATDAFMALELRVDCLRNISALARYVEEFSAVGA